MLRSLRIFWREDRGSALLEGAVLAPFLIILPFGVYEFSWFFYRQHLVSTGVHDAARYLARIAFNPCASPYEAAAKAIATKKGFTATAGVISGGTERVPGWTSSNVAVSCSLHPRSDCGASTPCAVFAPGTNSVRIVTVSTTYTPQSLGYFGILGLSAPSLTISHQERVIGPG